MSSSVLCVDGDVEQPLALSFEDLAAFPAAEQVADVSRFHPTRKGDGVTLEAILSRAKPRSSATYLTLHATAERAAGIIVSNGHTASV